MDYSDSGLRERNHQPACRRLRRETGGKGVDAIMAYPHNYGCSQLGDDHENTKKILRDMVLHPNAGAVLVVGLGCENNQPDVFREFWETMTGTA